MTIAIPAGLIAFIALLVALVSLAMAVLHWVSWTWGRALAWTAALGASVWVFVMTHEQLVAL